MAIAWTLVLDDGTRPYGPGIAVDQRRPLKLTISEHTVIDVSLINPVGGTVILGDDEFLVFNARSLCVPHRQIMTKRSVAIAHQRYRISIVGDDTKTFAPQRAAYDLWAVRSAGRAQLVPLSELAIIGSALGVNHL